MSFLHRGAHKWLGRYPMVDPDHKDNLEMLAAINEHHHRMPRAIAEEKAHEQYRREQIIEAAAHHLSGMKAAGAAGNHESAKKHATMYSLALRQLGHKDVVTPPEEVVASAKNTPSKEIGGFHAHRGDIFSLPPEPEGEDGQKMTKAEEDVPDGHQLGMKVPKGGSSCAKCEYVSEDMQKCGNEQFQAWNGRAELPAPADEYCCDLYQIGKK